MTEYMCVWAAVSAVFKPALLLLLIVKAICTIVACKSHPWAKWRWWWWWWCLPQVAESSSDPSPQSLSPSQKYLDGMHLALPGHRRRLTDWLPEWLLVHCIPAAHHSHTTRSTQPCIPPAYVTKSSSSGKGGSVASAGWRVTLCYPQTEKR